MIFIHILLQFNSYRVSLHFFVSFQFGSPIEEKFLKFPSLTPKLLICRLIILACDYTLASYGCRPMKDIGHAHVKLKIVPNNDHHKRKKVDDKNTMGRQTKSRQ